MYKLQTIPPIITKVARLAIFGDIRICYQTLTFFFFYFRWNSPLWYTWGSIWHSWSGIIVYLYIVQGPNICYSRRAESSIVPRLSLASKVLLFWTNLSNIWINIIVPCKFYRLSVNSYIVIFPYRWKLYFFFSLSIKENQTHTNRDSECCWHSVDESIVTQEIWLRWYITHFEY